MTNDPAQSAPPEVLIAGGGVAALEAVLALRDLAGDRARLTLLAPNSEFVYRPMTVREPFSYGVAQRFPLELLSRKADNFLNSTFANLSSIQKMEQPELLEINSADAQPRNIREGDWVRVFNERGEVRLRAHVNGSVQPGVVATRLTWAKLSPSRKSINALTSETLTDIGGGATFYSCLVEIEGLAS